MSDDQSIVNIIFLIFAGTAVLSTMALYTRQSLLVAYMILGTLFGPWCLGLVKDTTLIRQTGDIGILFLLFLLGLHLQPQNLIKSLRQMSWITLASSLIFFLIGFTLAKCFGWSLSESMVVGATTMFSSTILGLKLLPTTILHHQHTGELMVSILLLQDLIAIAVLMILQGIADRAFSFHDIGYIISAFPILLLVAYYFQRYVLNVLIRKFDRFHEYLFVLSIAWCLCLAELSHYFHLSDQIGAFIAGITLASNPISLYVAESLKPLRDFFLVIFFFTIGAGFNFGYLESILVPALILTSLILFCKPRIFAYLLKRSGETSDISWEVGVRLAQVSEFSLLVVYLSQDAKIISATAAYLVQAATIFTFIFSSYWVTMRYPTPLASTEKLRRD